ncbi:hypothetical protein [Burkholderia sp. b13]|nr:hypothetical protein [Burkholderia sp. b13]
MLQTKPGCYAFLGTGTSTHRTAGPALGPSGLHHASDDFNDEGRGGRRD